MLFIFIFIFKFIYIFIFKFIFKFKSIFKCIFKCIIIRIFTHSANKKEKNVLPTGECEIGSPV